MESRENNLRFTETIKRFARFGFVGASGVLVERSPSRRHLPRVADTCAQIYIHVVFAVEGRQNLIPTQHNIF